jgi:hypothetical protein
MKPSDTHLLFVIDDNAAVRAPTGGVDPPPE